MKIATIVAQVLVGLAFVVFGANGILNFLHAPPLPPGPGADFSKILMDSHYGAVVGAVQLIGGLLLLVNRYVPLGLTLLGPVIVNILLFHGLLMHQGWQPGVVIAILWFFLFFRYKANFAGIFTAKAV